MTSKSNVVVRALYRSLLQVTRVHDHNPTLKALLCLDDLLCHDDPLGTIKASKQLHATARRFLDGVAFRPSSNVEKNLNISTSTSMWQFVRNEFRRNKKRPIAEAKSEGFQALAILNKNVQDATTLKLFDDEKPYDPLMLLPRSSSWQSLDRPVQGCALIANPIQICDQLGRSVVILSRHDNVTGSLGFVINKATPLTFMDLAHYLLGLRNAVGVLSNNVIHAGGPTRTPLLALHPLFNELYDEDREDPLAKLQENALAAHHEKSEIRDGYARCGIGVESEIFEDEGLAEGSSAKQVSTGQHIQTNMSLQVSVVDDNFLDHVANMVATGRAKASQFKLVVGCVVWKKDQLASEWDRNYWYGAECSTSEVDSIALKQLTTQYANGTMNDEVGNIPRAGAFLKMRRMVGEEFLHLMVFGCTKWCQESLAPALFQGAKLIHLDDDAEMKAKREHFYKQLLENNRFVPYVLHTHLHEVAPSEVMADPDGIDNLFPNLSWDALMDISQTKFSPLENPIPSRWDKVVSSLGTTSGIEDSPNCDENVWASLLQSMGGEYASLSRLASKLSAQHELYSSSEESDDE